MAGKETGQRDGTAEEVAALRDDQDMAWKAIGAKFGFSASKARTLYREATGKSHTKSKASVVKTKAPDGKRVKDMEPADRRKAREEAKSERRKKMAKQKPYFTAEPEEEELWEVIQPGRTLTVRMGTTLGVEPYAEEYGVKSIRKISRGKPDGSLVVEFIASDHKYHAVASDQILEVR